MEHARTQIIATLGPASLDPSILKRLVAAGVDVFRVNLSHGNRVSHRMAIEAAATTRVKVMIDLPGPKIRIQDSTVPLPLKLKAGARLYLSIDKDLMAPGAPGLVLPRGLDLSRASAGSLVLIDDGNVELEIKAFKNGVLETVVLEDVEIQPRKGVAFVDEVADFPPLTDDDKKALDELTGSPFDWVAVSFVRSADCMTAVRDYLQGSGKNAFLIAKIENPMGVRNIEEILKVSDGIMVARGDLGVCTPLAALPVLQKRLVALAVYHRKTVVVATQMLESMTNNRRPTRAEVTDVANAVLDGADAVMLSGETAVGKYPVETVETMAEIIDNAEAAVRTGLKNIL